MKPIQDQIYEAIQEVASTSALMVVFDKSSGSNMLYTNPKHDISDKVLKKMGLKPGETLDEEGGESEGGEKEEDGDKTDGKAGGKNNAPSKGADRSPVKDK